MIIKNIFLKYKLKLGVFKVEKKAIEIRGVGSVIYNKKKTIDFMRKSIVLGGLVGLVLLYALLGLKTFFTVRNFLIIIQQSAALAIVGFGMTFIIIQGGIDLSVGSVVGVAGLALAYTLQFTGSSILAVLSALFVGLAFGLFNGLVHVKYKIPAFLTTLGTLSIGRGICIVWSKGVSVPIQRGSFTSKIGSLPHIIILMAVVLIIAFIISKYTTFGKYVRAIGDNEAAAKLVGISVNRVKLYCFIIGSVCAALGGIVLSSRIGAATPRTGEQMELDVIAAIVLGGTPLTGGIGGVERTLLGVILFVVLNNGLILLGISSDVQLIIKGFVLIVAVGASLDRDRIGTIK